MEHSTKQANETMKETQIPGKKNPYLFVVGCPRSGTTLLQRMLDHHPQLAVAYDTLFIPSGIKGIPIGTNPPITAEIIEKVCAFPRFPRLGLSNEGIRNAAADAKNYGEFVSALYSEFGALHGKVLAGEKSPGYCRHLPLLHGLFPWAKTIHLIRDGRDVALSFLGWKKGPSKKYQLWQEEPVAVSALLWCKKVAKGIQDGRGLGQTCYSEVRYEDLVSDPQKSLQRLAAFLELPFSPEMLKYYEGKTRTKPGRSAKSAWLPPTQGLRDWRNQMAERDVELFEAIAGDLLSQLGYERQFPTISPQITELAGKCQKWWDEEMARRGKTLSKRVVSENY